MFLAFGHRTTTEEAREEARLIDVDGQGLYDLKEEEWKDIYGIHGRLIWNHLYRSIYGWVLLSVSFISL